MEINDVLKMDNDFLPNSSNVSNEFIMILSWVYCSFQRHQFQKEIRWETCTLCDLGCIH
jgi:hypothetical protein